VIEEIDQLGTVGAVGGSFGLGVHDCAQRELRRPLHAPQPPGEARGSRMTAPRRACA
jgi:hypothetical protein